VPRQRCRDLDAWHRAVLEAPDLSVRRGDGRDLVPSTVVKLVAFALRAYMDGPGRDAGANARPGHDRLAAKLGLSAGPVRHAFRALLEHGYLIRTTRGHTGQNATYAAALPAPTADGVTPPVEESGDAPTPAVARTADVETPPLGRTADGVTPPVEERRCQDNTRGGVLTPPTSAVTSAVEDQDQQRPPPAGRGRGSSSVRSKAIEHPEAARLLAVFVEGCQHNGHPTPAEGDPRHAKWLRDVDLLLRRGPGDGGDPPPPEEVEEVMRAYAADVVPNAPAGSWPGWGIVVRSPGKLREKYPDLRRLAGRAPRRRQQDVSEFTESGRFQP
jgi:hypothetical protein